MAAQSELTGANVTRLLQIVPSVAAAISFLVLSLAFVHEWAYYNVVGSQFQSLVSITDYFNSAIGWLPWTVLGLCIAAIWRLTDKTRHVPRDVLAKSYKEHRVRWVYEKAPMWALYWMLMFAGAFQFLFGDWYTRAALEIFFLLLWVKILKSLVSQETIAQALTKEIGYLLLFGPAFLVLAFVGGMSEGAAAIAPDRQATAIGKYKNQYQEREWVLLRTLSSGLLIRDLRDKDKVQFVKWDDVASFQAKITQPNRNGLVCRVTGYTCLFSL